MGLVDDELQLGDGVPFIAYETGAKCNDTRWRTEIQFICQPKGEPKMEPKVIEDSNCLLVIQYPTEAVCQHEVEFYSEISIQKPVIFITITIPFCFQIFSENRSNAMMKTIHDTLICHH